MTALSHRLKLIVILALFVLPLLAAVLMYTGHLPLLSGKTSNLGKLVQPPVAMNWLDAQPDSMQAGIAKLPESWVILFPFEQPCEQSCLKLVAGLRQVHKASGRNQGRIEVALLTNEPVSDELRLQLYSIYDRFTIIADPDQVLWDSVILAKQKINGSRQGNEIYLVDPLGNIMMAYDTNDSEIRLSKDLKRLLTWSKQDKR
jgi:cytochrome oxidase Cu insertion factor (SCO1/SenC/PrrC family)